VSTGGLMSLEGKKKGEGKSGKRFQPKLMEQMLQKHLKKDSLS